MCRVLFFMSILLGSYGSLSIAASSLVTPYPVTLKAREANVRVGPGGRYPLAWKFIRPNIPLFVLAEVGTWRKIRDAEGSEGWIHQNMLSGRRSVLVIGGVRSLLKKPEPNASVLVKLEPGVSMRLCETRGEWVRVNVDGYSGWLARAHVWGLLAQEGNRRF